MKWVTPEKIKIEYRKTYFAKWPSGTVIKSTGWFQESDGTFFWNEQGYIPVLKKEWPMLLILDESPSAEVKEQQGELLPEEKEVINEWRRARLSVRKGKFGIAEERIEQAKKVIGEANDYYNDKTEIPELL